jgi:hypothetical protein
MMIYRCLLFYTTRYDIGLSMRKIPGREVATSDGLRSLRKHPRCDLGGPRAGRRGFRSRRSVGCRTVLFGCRGSVRLRSAGYFVCGGEGFQWVSVAAPAPQLDFNEHECLGSKLQTLRTSELMFRALLTKDGTKLIELARPSNGHPNVCTLTRVHAAPLRIVGGLNETIGLRTGTS